MKFFEYFAIFTVMMAGLNAMMPNKMQVGEVLSGKLQNPGTFPYIVHLEIEKFNATINAYEMFTCGGSIIRMNAILTAAHCVEGALPENVKVTAGIVHTGIFQESKQQITARRIVSHEEFRNLPTNNIALVFLMDKFQNSRYVDTITLARSFQYRNYMGVTAVGWDRLTNERQTEWLHREDFVMVDRTSCAPSIDGLPYNYYDEFICVLDTKGYYKLGSGDTGGPLVNNNFLVGVSVGNQRHPDDLYESILPSVYTNVSHYTNWISERIGYDILFFENML